MVSKKCIKYMRIDDVVFMSSCDVLCFACEFIDACGFVAFIEIMVLLLDERHLYYYYHHETIFVVVVLICPRSCGVVCYFIHTYIPYVKYKYKSNILFTRSLKSAPPHPHRSPILFFYHRSPILLHSLVVERRSISHRPVESVHPPTRFFFSPSSDGRVATHSLFVCV